MFTIEFKPCSIFIKSKIHINNTCSKNYEKCWKKCHTKLEALKYLVLANEKFKNAVVVNEPLIDTLED